MAIDTAATSGTDPSHPAFWVPGQDPTRTNIQASWTFAPCRGRGQPCAHTSDCCTGLACAPDAARGASVCQPVGCAALAEPCSTDADCCAAAPAARCRPNRDGVDACLVTAP
jgi:hypothetical protein